jgi:predicted nucleic acid-binding protein
LIVLDASVVVELLMRTEAGVRVEARLLGSSETLHAPHLIDVEVAQVVRRYEAIGNVDGVRAARALTVLAALPLERHAHALLLPRAWQLRHNLTIYDAMYVVLAELLDATLLTRDRRLAAAPLHRARMEVV